MSKTISNSGGSGQRQIIVVVGMHRSGTSVMARGLQALGVDLGTELVPPAEENPRGFWENPSIIQLDDELFAAQGLAWDSACLIPEIDASRDAFQERARTLIRTLTEDSALSGFKDPRAARLLGFWRPVFEQLELRDSYVLIIRNPEDVVASLHARNKMPRVQGLLLWAFHNLDALSAIEGMENSIVDYDDLLARPDAELRRVAKDLELPVNAESSAAIESYGREFLTVDLRHHHDPGAPRDEEPLSQTIFEMYRVLRAVARGDMTLQSNAAKNAIASVRNFVTSAAPLLERAARSNGDAGSSAENRTGTWGARIDPRMPALLSMHERTYIEVICTNDGSRIWTPDRVRGPHLRLAYHVRSHDGAMLLWDGERTPITFPVPPGGQVRLQANFAPITEPGDYFIEWDMVSEGECWFQLAGSTTAITPLRVTAPDVVEPSPYPVQVVPESLWSPRFQKPLADVRVAIAVRAWNVIQHNRREVFERTLNSLSEAGHPFKLFLVDNGSTDGTAELVAQRGGYLAPRVGEQNGAGHGMNVAIQQALLCQPDLVVFSDDDIEWHPGFLRRLVEFWAHAPHDIALISGFLEPRWHWNTIRGAVDCGTVRAYVRETASGGAWSFPAVHWRWIGPLIPGMEADWEACHRLRRAGFRLGQADLATHIGVDSSTWNNSPPPGVLISEAVRNAALERAIGERDVQLAAQEQKLAVLHPLFEQIQAAIDETQRQLLDIAYPRSISQARDSSIPSRPEHLLTLYDRDFVVNAYRILLRREPDPNGLGRYLSQLRQGKSRHEVIRSIRYSPEGASAAVDVGAIRVGLAVAMLFALPLVGRFIRLAASFLTLPTMEKERRAFEARKLDELERIQSERKTVMELMTRASKSISSDGTGNADN